jgi:MFS transporter, DHA3 family, tetracycline resistance protein
MNRSWPLFTVLRNREARLLLSGQSISSFGNGVSNIALTLLVLDLKHSVSALGLFAAFRMIPLVIFILFGGIVVDRFARRTLLLLSDGVRAVVTATMALLLWNHHLSFSLLLVGAFIFGLFDALFMPAMTAFIPEIVKSNELQAMNGIRPLAGQIFGAMLGPAVGGVLSAHSIPLAIAIDSATFVVSAGALSLMRAAPAPERTEKKSIFTDLQEGANYVRQTTWMWGTLAAVSISNGLVFSPMMVLLVSLMRKQVHLSNSSIGFALAFFGVVSAVAALVSTSLKPPRKRVRTMVSMWLISACGVIVASGAHSIWPLMVSAVMTGPTLLFGNVIWESLMQTEVPRELLGRASSVDWFVSLGLTPVGLIAAGSLAAWVGTANYLRWAPLICSLPTVMLLLSRKANLVDAAR